MTRAIAASSIYMLEPGALMLKIAGLPAFLGIVAHGLKMRLIAVILLSAAGLIAAVLLILVRVELHQDKVPSEIARRKTRRRNAASDCLSESRILPICKSKYCILRIESIIFALFMNLSLTHPASCAIIRRLKGEPELWKLRLSFAFLSSAAFTARLCEENRHA